MVLRSSTFRQESCRSPYLSSPGSTPSLTLGSAERLAPLQREPSFTMVSDSESGDDEYDEDRGQENQAPTYNGTQSQPGPQPPGRHFIWALDKPEPVSKGQILGRRPSVLPPPYAQPVSEKAPYQIGRRTSGLAHPQEAGRPRNLSHDNLPSKST